MMAIVGSEVAKGPFFLGREIAQNEWYDSYERGGDMEFGRKVRVLRAVADLTQWQLADMMGWKDRAMVWRIESGQVMPGAEMERELRAALGWTEEMEVAFAILEGVGVEPAMQAAEMQASA